MPAEAKTWNAAFNQTKMELKHQPFTRGVVVGDPFNQTKMELKHKRTCPDHPGAHAFNQTKMELKLLPPGV